MSVQDVVSVVEEALDTNQALIFDYHGENRRVTPQEVLVTKAQAQVLVAIQGADGYRRFRVDEIKNIHLVS